MDSEISYVLFKIIKFNTKYTGLAERMGQEE